MTNQPYYFTHFVFIALFSMSCGVTSEEIKSTQDVEDSCKEANNEMSEVYANARVCNVDADCVERRFGCPFGCSNSAINEEKIPIIRDQIRKFDKKCEFCMAFIIECPVPDYPLKAKCIDKVCTLVEFTENEKREWEQRYKLDHTYTCERKLAGYGNRRRAICYDYVNTGWRGPLMVVVPTGGEFNSNFAIGKYEISLGDYGKYCAITKACPPEKNKENFYNPVTEISLDEAKAYVAWLSERTGKTYRLPTSSEWKYAANADGNQPEKDFNCGITDENSERTGVQRRYSGQPNGWGLKNYIGNVQEWVVTDSGEVMVIGGNFNTPIEECSLDYMKAHDGSADEFTGFRILLEME